MSAYDRWGNLVDVMQWLRALRQGKPSEMRARVLHNAPGAPRWIEGRLVAERLPDKEAEEARRRVRRDHGSEATAEMLETAGEETNNMQHCNTGSRTESRLVRRVASLPGRRHSVFALALPCWVLLVFPVREGVTGPDHGPDRLSCSQRFSPPRRKRRPKRPGVRHSRVPWRASPGS